MAKVRMKTAITGNGTGRMTHAQRVEFIDNSQKVLAQLNTNKPRAALAVGTKAVGMIVNQMQTGYGKPIRQTGDLQRDVSYEVVNDSTVNVGNTLEYAPFVHDGTSKMGARQYIRDALMNSNNQSTLQRVYEEYLKQGFGN